MISSKIISKGLVKPSLFYCTNSKMYFTKNTLITSFRSYSTENSNPNNVPPKYKKRKIFSKVILITAATLLFISIKDYQETLNEDELIRPTSWPLYLYSRLPLNTVSRLWGQFNNMTLPVWLRGPGYKLYSYLFGANLNEILDPDLTHYKNLGEFFYRKIKPESRPIDESALLCSPSDGRVLKFGVVDDSGDIEQVKGMTYKIEALLGTIDSKKLAIPSVSIEYPDSDQSSHQKFVEKLHNDPSKQQKLVHVENKGDKSMLHPSTSQVFQATRALSPTNTNNKLFYAVIYLAPGDYHRFHSPTTWVTTLRRHFVGELYSVAPYFQKTFSNLFVLNERVALLGYWKYGFFSMTPVGATNVGSIKINFDRDLVTNTSQLDGKKVKKNTCYEATYSNASQLLGGHPLLKGDEIGGFMLGSTVVLVFEAPENFEFDLQEGQNVKMGQKIGELVKK